MRINYFIQAMWSSIASKKGFAILPYLAVMTTLSVLPIIPVAATGYFQQLGGSVIDDRGTALQGVTVSLKGTMISTQTDTDGQFAIAASRGDVLVFSMVGYETQEKVVEDSDAIDIVLLAIASDLDEVVVVGYGTQRRATLTGAVSTINTREVVNISTPNLSNTLAGRAPGMNVTNTSGLSGATSAIRIRGSFAEPLYVIDGVVRDKGAFDALEAFEVDQISVLKDAAAASIYGSRAGNGVVLVTTRRGIQQKPTFNYQSNYMTSRPTMTLLSDLQSATDELIYQNRVAEFNGTALPNGEEEFAYFSDKDYNVHDFIWRNPSAHRHSIGVNGGSDRVTYNSLLSYRGENGSYTSLDHQNVNLRSNVSAKINESITVDLNISATQQNHNRFYWPFSGDDDFDVSDLYRVTFNWPRTYPFYTEADGTPANYVTDFPVQTPMGSWLAWSVIDQIVGDRYINSRERQFNSIMSVNFDLGKFIPGLSTRVMGSFVGEDFLRKRYLTFQRNYVFNQADPDGNRFIPAPPDPNRTNVFNFSSNEPFMDYNINSKWEYQVNWFLTYSRKFADHSVDALFVYEQAEDKLHAAFARAERPLTSYDQMFAYPADRELRQADGWEEIGARKSYIGRANYTYLDRYTAEFSFRYDGNTLFPVNGRWGFFPSVSASWRISEESFFEKATDIFSELKLRGSYGTTGSDLDVNGNRITPFSFNYRYLNTGGYIFGDRLMGAIGPGPTPNPNLTWATNTFYNIGLDYGLFNQKLTGSIEAFLREETDILGSRLVTLPDNYGQALAPENYAARSFRGVEVSTQWTDNALGGELNYSILANLGYAVDRWDVFDEAPAYGPDGNRNFESRIGLPHDRIIGLRSLGLIRDQELLDELLAQGLTQFGRQPYLGGLYFEDIRGDGYAPGADGRIDANDNQLLSTRGAPRINYGLGINLSYKNFVLQTLFQGVMAYDRIISNQEGAGMRQHGGVVRPYYPIWASDDVWTPDNPDGIYPRPIGQNWFESGTGSSSFWIRNGAYFRLKNLNLGYNLPTAWAQSMKLDNLQVFFNGTNLFVFSPMTEFHDPEQRNYDSFPVMKTFTFGVDIRF